MGGPCPIPGGGAAMDESHHAGLLLRDDWAAWVSRRAFFKPFPWGACCMCCHDLCLCRCDGRPPAWKASAARKSKSSSPTGWGSSPPAPSSCATGAPGAGPAGSKSASCAPPWAGAPSELPGAPGAAKATMARKSSSAIIAPRCAHPPLKRLRTGTQAAVRSVLASVESGVGRLLCSKCHAQRRLPQCDSHKNTHGRTSEKIDFATRSEQFNEWRSRANSTHPCATSLPRYRQQRLAGGPDHQTYCEAELRRDLVAQKLAIVHAERHLNVIQASRLHGEAIHTKARAHGEERSTTECVGKRE